MKRAKYHEQHNKDIKAKEKNTSVIYKTICLIYYAAFLHSISML